MRDPVGRGLDRRVGAVVPHAHVEVFAVGRVAGDLRSGFFGEAVGQVLPRVAVGRQLVVPVEPAAAVGEVPVVGQGRAPFPAADVRVEAVVRRIGRVGVVVPEVPLADVARAVAGPLELLGYRRHTVRQLVHEIVPAEGAARGEVLGVDDVAHLVPRRALAEQQRRPRGAAHRRRRVTVEKRRRGAGQFIKVRRLVERVGVPPRRRETLRIGQVVVREAHVVDQERDHVLSACRGLRPGFLNRAAEDRPAHRRHREVPEHMTIEHPVDEESDNASVHDNASRELIGTRGYKTGDGVSPIARAKRESMVSRGRLRGVPRRRFSRDAGGRRASPPRRGPATPASRARG